MIQKQGIFSDPWLPAAMLLPQDALRSRVVTGPMPGYGPGRVAALSGIPPGIRQRIGMRPFGFDPQPEPPGKLRATRSFAPSFGCCAGFGQAPTDPVSCIARGGTWNISTMLCQMPATLPPAPPSEPTPATPAVPALPALTPALCSAQGGVWNLDTNQCDLPGAAAPAPTPATTPAPAAEAAPSGMPTWAYVGIAGAIVVVVAAVALS